MKKIFVLLVAVLALLCTTACVPLHDLLGEISPQPDNSIPGRLVRQVDVCTVAEDTSTVESYTAQEDMAPILRQLRDMRTTETPEETVQLDSAFVYYTITATYVDGSQRVYELINQQYLRSGDDPWCEVESGKYQAFAQFLAEITVEETAPTEATQPEETTAE